MLSSVASTIFKSWLDMEMIHIAIVYHPTLHYLSGVALTNNTFPYLCIYLSSFLSYFNITSPWLAESSFLGVCLVYFFLTCVLGGLVIYALFLDSESYLFCVILGPSFYLTLLKRYFMYYSFNSLTSHNAIFIHYKSYFPSSKYSSLSCFMINLCPLVSMRMRQYIISLPAQCSPLFLYFTLPVSFSSYFTVHVLLSFNLVSPIQHMPFNPYFLHPYMSFIVFHPWCSG